MNKHRYHFLILTFLLLLLNRPAVAGIKYNRAINQAELAIAAQQYSSAAGYYKAAFGENQEPPATDLENALLVAIAAQNQEDAFAYARKLAALGAGQAYFAGKSAFAWLKTKPGWARLIQDAESQQSAILQLHYELRTDLQQLAQKHQSLIDRSFSARGADSLRLLNNEKKNIETQLQTLFLRQGYLSEYKTGLFMVSDTLIGDPVFTGILKDRYLDLPSHQRFTTPGDTLSRLLIMVQAKGEVGFDYIARVCWSDSVRVAAFNLPVYSRCVFYLCRDESNAWQSVDQARAALGLSSTEEYLVKLRYSITHPETPFRIGMDVRQYFTSNAMEADPDLIRGCTVIGRIERCR